MSPAVQVTVPGWVLISAFRYALGRRTYIVADTAGLLIAHKDSIPVHDRQLIAREITAAIRSGAAGMGMDVDEWIACRDAMETEDQQETGTGGTS